jgi:hypothetical protein
VLLQVDSQSLPVIRSAHVVDDITVELQLEMDHISEDMSPGSDHSRDQTVQEMFDNRDFHDMEDSLSFSSQQEQERERQHQQHQHQIYHQHHPYMHMQHRKQSQSHMYPGHPTWHTARPHPHFVTAYGNPFFAQQHHPTLMLAHAHKHVTETKARFAKHEVEVLEAEFQKNHKPNSIIKRGLAEKMGVEVPRINVRTHRVPSRPIAVTVTNMLPL